MKNVRKLLALLLALMLGLSLCAPAMAADEEAVTTAETTETTEATEATESPYTELDVECKSGELTLRGKMTMPVGYEEGDTVPMVILSHGFMSNIGELAFAPYATAYALADAGYASVRFNFGGTPDSDGEFVNMTTSSEIADLNAILDYVLTLEFVQKENIFLSGNSFGGVVTALTAPDRADDINAITLWFPAMSMFDDARNGYVQDVQYDTENLPETLEIRGMTVGKAFLEENLTIDPYAPAAEYKGDVLILHGAEDFLVPIASSEKLVEMYENATLVPVEGGGHGFYDPETMGFATSTMIAFLDEHLVVEPEPEPETPTCPFVDIEDEATIAAVMHLYGEGVIKGTSETTYEPGKTLDRAEFMTILGRAAGATVDHTADTGFSDVVADGWSVGYIAWGVEHGLIEGYGDGTFGQYDTLTKEHVNTIIGRFNEKFNTALFNTITPFAEAEGDATRAEIAVMLSEAIAGSDFMARMMLPKTQAKYLNPKHFAGWGAFPDGEDYVQGLSASRNPNMDTAIELYDLLTYTNKDENDHELAQSIQYYVHDPIKHGADPNGKYPVQVWFHGAGNAIDGSGAVGASGAILFATEEYQELMGTPVYVIVPLANEYKNERGGNEGTWLTNTEDGSTSVYTKVLGDLVSDFMAEHADTVSTLHINGTSAGGYMAWRYTMAYSDTIDSTFLMAPALFGIGEEDVDAFLEKTKDFPVLHIHGLHDEMIRYENIVAPFEDKFNAAENYQLVPFEWVRTRDGGVASMMFGIEMGQHCICAQVAEDLKYADGTPMHEDIPNGVTGWYKEILGN